MSPDHLNSPLPEVPPVPARRDFLVNVALGTLMLGTVAVSQLAVRRRLGRPTPLPRLQAQLPGAFDSWQPQGRQAPQPVSAKQRAAEDLYDELAWSDYLAGDGARVSLYLAYINDCRARRYVHSPKICYPAQGFEVVEQPPLSLQSAQANLMAERIQATAGGVTHHVSYWYVMAGRVLSFRLQGPFIGLHEALAGRSVPELLVRLSTYGGSAEAAAQIQQRFYRDLLASAPEPFTHLLVGRQG